MPDPTRPDTAALLDEDGQLDQARWRATVTQNLTAIRGLLDQAGARLPEPPAPDASHADWQRAVSQALAAANDLIPELTAAVSPDPGFTAMVCDIFRDCSWALGFEWRGERAPAGWTPPWNPSGDQDPPIGIYAAVEVLHAARHRLAPDVLRSLADIWTCGSAARYHEPHERFWDDPAVFTGHDTAGCEEDDPEPAELP
jgi:hypothetical protein